MIKIGLISNVVFINQIVYRYYREETSSILKANKTISVNERFYQFYERFALPYFFKRKDLEPYKSSFFIAEHNAYKILVRILKYEVKLDYMEKYFAHNHKYVIKKYRRLKTKLFSILPLRFADMFYYRLLRIFGT